MPEKVFLAKYGKEATREFNTMLEVVEAGLQHGLSRWESMQNLSPPPEKKETITQAVWGMLLVAYYRKQRGIKDGDEVNIEVQKTLFRMGLADHEMPLYLADKLKTEGVN